MPTLRDLSKHLGLSVTQVSRALNGHSDVGAETRERVLAAARKLNYQPNLSARKLVSGRSGMVALVLPGVPATEFDTLFVQIVGGLSQHFSARNVQFVLHISSPGDDPIRVYERLVNSGSLDGFVVLEPIAKDPRIAFLRKRNVPFVLHGRLGPAPDYPFFDIDNEQVGYDLAKLLIDAGHQRIAFINGLAGRTYADARTLGFKRALSEAGITPQPRFFFNGEMTNGFGLASAARLWSEKQPPTAIVCGNMLIANGVFMALEAMGVSVPADVSVVGHDDQLPGIQSARMPTPLTVTSSPLQESWKPIADILVGAVAEEPIASLQRFGHVSIIRRQSVAAPPKSL